MKTVIDYKPTNLRVQEYSHAIDLDFGTPIGYSDDSAFSKKCKSLLHLDLASLRLMFGMLQEYNKLLSESIFFVKIEKSHANLGNRFLSLGTFLTSMKNLIMLPVKLDLSNRVMSKTT
jgi:hypothetical protein